MKLGKLETEILSSLRSSKSPMSVYNLLQVSDITSHSRRMSACVLSLEDTGMVKLCNGRGNALRKYKAVYKLNE